MKEGYDQIKMELEEDTDDLIKVIPPSENIVSAPHKRHKRASDPKTLSIDTDQLDNEEDQLTPPKKEVFNKYAGNSIKDFHNDGNENDDNLRIDDTFKSSSSADQKF